MPNSLFQKKLRKQKAFLNFNKAIKFKIFIMQRPTAQEYNQAYYAHYDNLMPDGNLMANLQTVHQASQLLLRDLSIEKANYAYEAGKWTIKQVIQHLIDTERIMSYRALCIARGESQSLPGFDQNMYAYNANVENISLQELLGEWHLLRLTTIQLFSRFSAEESLLIGKANGHAVSVRALAFLILGHELHHIRVLKERYL